MHSPAVLAQVDYLIFLRLESVLNIGGLLFSVDIELNVAEVGRYGLRAPGLSNSHNGFMG